MTLDGEARGGVHDVRLLVMEVMRVEGKVPHGL